MIRRPPRSTLFPYPPLFRSHSTHFGDCFFEFPSVTMLPAALHYRPQEKIACCEGPRQLRASSRRHMIYLSDTRPWTWPTHGVGCGTGFNAASRFAGFVFGLAANTCAVDCAGGGPFGGCIAGGGPLTGGLLGTGPNETALPFRIWFVQKRIWLVQTRFCHCTAVLCTAQ